MVRAMLRFRNMTGAQFDSAAQAQLQPHDRYIKYDEHGNQNNALSNGHTSVYPNVSSSSSTGMSPNSPMRNLHDNGIPLTLPLTPSVAQPGDRDNNLSFGPTSSNSVNVLLDRHTSPTSPKDRDNESAVRPSPRTPIQHISNVKL
jgi:hypothetical protein